MTVSLSLSKAMFIVALASRLPRMRKVFRAFATKSILNPIMIASICSLPLVSFLMGGAMLMAEHYCTVTSPVAAPVMLAIATGEATMPSENSVRQANFPVGAPVMLALATLTLCGLYYRNRSHKHGNLIIQTDQRGMAVVAAIALAYTAQYAQITTEVASVFLPILVGSVVTTLLCLVFASVADAWDAVGSGQFQMISLDTAAILGTVVAPLLVLASIASDKYGETVSETVARMLQKCISEEFIKQQGRPPERAKVSGLFLLLALATMVGVPLANMLSPLGAYLMSKAYTNGQPRTRRVGLCVHLKDLLGESKEKVDETINHLMTRFTADKKPALNFFVTADELRLFPDIIRKLRSEGHAFGICSSTVEGITEAYEVYVEVLKISPQWYHVGSQGGASRGPDALKTARDLELKVAFWSTHMGVTSREVLFNMDLPHLRDDVAATCGGSFIYLTDDWKDSDAMMAAIETIVQDLGVDSPDIKYSFSALSNVAKEDSPMIL